MTTGMRLLVGAIDFGTTYSGWAFSFKHDYKSDPTKAVVKNWQSRSGTLVSDKTPTCLLVKPGGKTFQAFGYDAENEYRDLIDENQHREYYYFRRFKMMLYKKLGKGLSRNMTIDDEFGKPLLALDVFAMSIKFLADDMMENASKGITDVIQPSDIQWVLTVPAIWSDAAKQFMREAAEKAGIPKERLTIALEPEAASLYCRHLSVHTSVDSSDVSVSELPPCTKYIVLDAGGGTIDITIHETGSTNTLREVRAANGGDWGGTMVDKAFKELLISVVGKQVYEHFKVEETEDWLDMCREFESKKRDFVGDRKGKIGMRFPVSLTDIYTRETKLVIQDTIASSKYAGCLELVRDKMKFSKDLMNDLFEESLQEITNHIKKMFNDEQLKDVKLILMVGGYSESTLLQKAVKESLPGLQVVIPRDASSTIMRGALIYGHNPLSITERILKFTYGTSYTPLFVEGIHLESKRFTSSDGDRCRGVFSKLLEIGKIVTLGETQITGKYFTVQKNQSAMIFKFYASEKKDTYYVDEEECVEIGEIRIVFEEPSVQTDREVNVSMMFGGTEINASVEDVLTGNKTLAILDFLG